MLLGDVVDAADVGPTGHSGQALHTAALVSSFGQWAQRTWYSYSWEIRWRAPHLAFALLFLPL